MTSKNNHHFNDIQERNEKPHTAGFSDFELIQIWLFLIVLTGVTITSSVMGWGAFSILLTILLATLKASLVILYFMNIAKEPLIFKVMLGVALATLAVIMILTFSDVSFR